MLGRDVIPGRQEVGFTRLAGEPGIHNPRRYGGCDVSQLQHLWLWIPELRSRSLCSDGA